MLEHPWAAAAPRPRAREMLSAEQLDSAAGAAKAPEQGVDVFAALFEIDLQLQVEQLSADRVLNLIVEKTAALLQTDVTWISLFDQAATRVRVAASVGARSPDFGDMEVELEGGIIGVAFRKRRTLVVTDYPAYVRKIPTYVQEIPSFVRETVLNEGIVSYMCTPMLCADEVVGVLNVANRRKTAFGIPHTLLLSTLAAHASVAIHNVLLYRQLRERTDLLEHSFAIHRELTSVELREGGFEGVAQTLAHLLGAPFTIEQEIVQPFRVRYDAEGHEVEADANEPDPPVTVAPIVAMDERLGRISVYGDELSELQRCALDHGATAIALELLKQRASREVEWRLQGELLEELIEATDPLPETIVLRARRLNVDPSAPRQVFAIESNDQRIDPDRLLTTVRVQATGILGARWGALAIRRGPRVILAMTESPENEARLVEALQEATATAASMLSIGVSRPNADLGQAYREATACLRLAQRATGETVIRAADLGPLRFVLDATDLDQATRMVQEYLGPVVESDVTGKMPLFDTLRHYLDADGHQPTVAARCFIHVSTLKYRLSRIQPLFDRPLSSPDLRFELRLAFRVLDLLEALDIDPLDGKRDQASAA